MIKESFAQVPLAGLRRADCKVWYIPHHCVYHHRKPEKLRVVFDCSVQFRGHSINNELFQGPDLTTNLVGVLICFRQNQVAVMGDIQATVHQVCVPIADHDLLRFLW